MKTPSIALVVIFALLPAWSQNSEAGKTARPVPPSFSAEDLAAKVPAARADDVKSIDSIMHAIYDVISGPMGSRDWDRFRSLFLPQARLTHAGKKADGSGVV